MRDPTAEFLPADPRYRRQLFASYAVGLVLLIGLPSLLGPALLHWITGHEPRVQVLLADSIAITFLAAFLPPSLFIRKTGRKTLSEMRYPHSGMRMLYDTPVHRGKAALRRGRLLVGLGNTGVVTIIVGSLAIHFICYKFLTDPFFFVR